MKRVWTAFLVLYLSLFVGSMAALFFIPEDNHGLRRIAFILVYGTSMPMFVVQLFRPLVRWLWRRMQKGEAVERED